MINEKFFKFREKMLYNNTFQIQEIRLNNCDLGDFAGNQIIRFMDKVERFHISYCNLTDSDLLLIKTEYGKIPDPVSGAIYYVL